MTPVLTPPRVAQVLPALLSSLQSSFPTVRRNTAPKIRSRILHWIIHVIACLLFLEVDAQTPTKPTLVGPGNSGPEPGQYVVGPNVTLRWNSSPLATRYQVNWRNLPNNQLFNQTVTAPTTSLTVTLLPGHTYRWNVFPFNGTVQGPVSDTLYFAVTLPAPTGLSPGTSSYTGHRVSSLTPRFTWTAVPQASGYIIYISKAPYGEANIIHSQLVQGGTSYKPPQGVLAENTDYRYDLSTIAGDFEGPTSANRYFTTPGRPNSPVNLAAFGGETVVSLAWSDRADNEDEFIVERQRSSGGLWVEIGRTPTDILAFLDQTALPGVPYNYRIIAANAYGVSAPSSLAQAARTGSGLQAPDNLLAQNLNGTIRLTWRDNSSNETGFEIERRQIPTGELQTFTASASTVSYDDESAQLGIEYCYVVRARNAVGPSADSDRSCVTPGRAPPRALISVDNPTPIPGARVRFRNMGTTGSKYTATWYTDEGVSTGHTVDLTFNSRGAKTIRLVVSSDGFLPDEGTKSILVETSVVGTGQGGSSGNTQPVHGADPVNLASGSYFFERTILKLPGIGIPLELAIHYDSLITGTQIPRFGIGWNYTPYITVRTNNLGAIVFYGDGHSEVHTFDNGEYRGDPGVFDRLVKGPNETWQVINKQQTTNHVDRDGRLVLIQDRNGNTLSLEYENDPLAQGRLRRITDTVGRITEFHPDATYPALIGRIEDVLGRTIGFTYDGSTNLVALTNAAGRVTTFTYNDRHQITDAHDNRGNLIVHNDFDPLSNAVTNQVDAFGQITRFTFDFENRVTTQINAHDKASTYRFDHRLLLTNITDEAGFTQAYEYDANRNRVLIQDRNGNITRLAYDVQGNIIKRTDAMLQESNVVYDERNNPTVRVDASGQALTIGYDARGNATHTTNALGYVTSVSYLENGLPEVITDARGHSITNVWESGNLVATIDALSNRTLMFYDAGGRKTHVVDALGRTNAIIYDVEDHVTATVDALGWTTKASFDGNGNLVSTLNARNALTFNHYDLRDRLVESVDPLLGVVSSFYDALDRRIAFVDQRGNRTAYGLDPLGRTTSITNALNQVVRFSFDPNGNQTATEDSAGNTTATFFDPLNRAYATVDALGHTNLVKFDALGRIVVTTNVNGQITSFGYDALGRLTNVIDALGQSSSFQYDASGNKTRQTDPRGNSWTNVFDSAGRLVEHIDPLGNRTLLRYDAVSNLTNKITPNGASIFFQYDARNQLTNVVQPDGSRITFGYDPVGNRTNMVDQMGTTDWTFDLLNHLVGTTDPFGQTVYNRFDQAGNRTELRYPDGKQVLYGYDSLNRLESLTNWLGGEVRYLRDSRGAVTNIINANGTTVHFDHDALGRLTNIVNLSPTSAVISSEGLHLDPIGNLSNVIDIKTLVPILQSTNVAYSYDAANRLTAVNGRAATHDRNGNLTGLGSDSYRFDYNDRLISYAVGGTLGGQYQYDGVGNRLQHTTNGVARRFVLDRLGALTQVLTDTDDTGIITSYYVYGLGLAQRIMRDGATDTYHFDHRGSTVALSSSTGELVSAYAYDSFGSLLNIEEENPQPFRFLGRHGLSDDGAGLYYVRARFYSPALGRFLTKDPLTGLDSNPQSLNRYIYSLNNPFRYFDPSGLSAQELNPAQSGWRRNFTDAIRGAILGDMAGDIGGYGTAARVAVGFIPIVGQIADIRDLGYQIYEASQGRANAQDIGFALIAFVPGIGDAAKTGGKLLKNADELNQVTKLVPNPFGKLGGPAHQAKVAEVAAGIESRGLEAGFEHMVPTPAGSKTRRFVDAVGRDPMTGEIVEMHQVGRQTMGGLPVSRERTALDDIQAGSGIRPKFHPYNP